MTKKLDGSCPKCGYMSAGRLVDSPAPFYSSNLMNWYKCGNCDYSVLETYSLVKSEVVEE